MAAENADVTNIGGDRVEQESPPVYDIDDESNAHSNGLRLSSATAADEDDLDDLDDMEFILDEIENRIAPLA